MGRATVESGGEDGRYVISLDFGEGLKTALLAALSIALAEVETRIAGQQVRVDEAQAKEDIQAQRYRDEIDLFIAAHPTFSAGAPRPDDSAVVFELSQLRQKQTATRLLRDQLNALKFDRAQVFKRIAYWNNFIPTDRRPAWCVDFTEDAAIGSTVATVEIPGESGLILIAPGAPTPTSADGHLVAREVMSPEQAFWNAAVLPGWQKFKPTYRWGTITAINTEADTCSLTLATATSSARSLDVNQTTTLTDVPIVYMVCHSAPFDVGSRVVVKFTGQDWTQPTVIGFLDNPRPCAWTCIGNQGAAEYKAISPGVIDSFNSTELDVRVNVNGGGWVAVPFDLDNYLPGERVSFAYEDVEGEIPLATVDVNLTPSTEATPYGSISCLVRPYQPFGESVNTAEFAIYIGGDIAFNVAQTDPGPSGSSFPHPDQNKVKTRGGIRIASGYFPVTRLDYTLISEA